LELRPADPALKAKLALITGYLQAGRDANAAGLRFMEAARLQPKWPDPHLALARGALRELHNIGQGTSELKTAERLGYKPGPRESVDLGDAFVYRAEQFMRTAGRLDTGTQRDKLNDMAHRDLDRARDIFEPLSGFANVDQALERIDKDRAILDTPHPRIVQSHTKTTRHTTSKRRRAWR
jgi:hypothetical protein